MQLFGSKRPHYEHLRKKWVQKHRDTTQNLVDKHLRKVAISSLGGLMLLSTPGLSSTNPLLTHDNQVQVTGKTSRNALLATDLKTFVPKENRNLTPEEEHKVIAAVDKELGIKIAAEIDNKRLNRTYGLIGGEQHLYRYPGDTLNAHATNTQDWAMYGGSGIAPGLGAWGYFAPSKAVFDSDPVYAQRERYYLAVQTFLSPGFSERVGEYRDFYKFRKMLVVNPQTGQAVVAVIGDAGPSPWTGKSLGGSPEVMEAVGLANGPRKGAVLYFFIDDSQNNIPLGPVKLDDGLLAHK